MQEIFQITYENNVDNSPKNGEHRTKKNYTM
jgi:hypothetical protein